ncbi:MAG TPA: sigma-70 family RNA polymerase sigma factor [Pseudosphingobacterium sp.]|nr:sigma-70 family RNA polymerase sigma factor [Pseudosphingobacterium sp.]
MPTGIMLMEHLYGQDLITRIKEGDGSAFEILYQQNWQHLYIFAVRRLNDEEEAKDVVQEVFINLWTKRHSILIHQNVAGYLMQMTKNEIIRKVQQALRNQEKTEQYRLHIIPSLLQIYDHLSHKELEKHLQKEVASLPLRQQQIYKLHNDEDLSISEIAENLEISEQTVKNQLVTANKKIRTALREALFLAILYHIH